MFSLSHSISTSVINSSVEKMPQLSQVPMKVEFTHASDMGKALT